MVVDVRISIVFIPISSYLVLRKKKVSDASAEYSTKEMNQLETHLISTLRGLLFLQIKFSNIMCINRTELRIIHTRSTLHVHIDLLFQLAVKNFIVPGRSFITLASRSSSC